MMHDKESRAKKIEQLEAKIAMGKLDDILKNKTVIGSAEVQVKDGYSSHKAKPPV